MALLLDICKEMITQSSKTEQPQTLQAEALEMSWWKFPKMAYYMEKSGNIITCKVLIGDVDAKTVDARYSYLPLVETTRVIEIKSILVLILDITYRVNYAL